MTARLRALAERRHALVAQAEQDRQGVAHASGALVAPLAAADVARDAAATLRAPPPLVTWGERLLAGFELRAAATALRWGWVAYVVALAGRRAVRVVERAERAL